MKAKEAANHLYKQFWDKFPAQSAIHFDLKEYVKDVCVLAVEEIIDSVCTFNSSSNYYYHPENGQYTCVGDKNPTDFWWEVIKEIKLL